MKKLLVVVGPTAIGKTNLALQVAKKYESEIISADSRQVYEGMDIGTGKDKPVDKKIWGYDLVDPKEEFSVAQYIQFARKKIAEIHKQKKLPILVGGTGFYISGVIDGIETAGVPKNENLREKLKSKSVAELFEMLAHLDPEKAASMNQSDKKNPARLVRAIEVASAKGVKLRKKKARCEALMIGLKAPKEILDKRIEKRVERRIADGFEKEVEKLLADGASWNDQSMQAMGYRQWKNKNKKKAIADWQKAEKQYARRQMTWFKKDKRIKWFDITENDWQKSLEDTVSSWYSSANDA